MKCTCTGLHGIFFSMTKTKPGKSAKVMGPPRAASCLKHLKPRQDERPHRRVKDKRTIGFQVAFRGGTEANLCAMQYALGQNISKYYTLQTPIKVKHAFSEVGDCIAVHTLYTKIDATMHCDTCLIPCLCTGITSKIKNFHVFFLHTMTRRALISFIKLK